MKIEITPEMIRKLRAKMLRERLSTLDIGSAAGLQPSTIARILRGETKTIQEQTYYRLSPYLTATDTIHTADPELELREPEPPPWRANEGRTLTPISPSEMKRVPVMSIARAAGYMPDVHLEFANYCELLGGDYEVWEQVPAGHHLFRVDGHSHRDLLPHGSVIQVDFNRYPRSGELVLARLSSQEFPIVKYYKRKDNLITLESTNTDPDEGTNYTIDLREPGDESIIWMRPVVKYSAIPPRRP